MNNLERNTDSMQKATSQNSSFFEFELLKNIDQPIPVILVKVDTYTLHSYVRGYHAYHAEREFSIRSSKMCPPYGMSAL